MQITILAVEIIYHHRI